MKRKFITLFIILLAFFCLTGCDIQNKVKSKSSSIKKVIVSNKNNNKNKKDERKIEKSNLVGKYVLIKMKSKDKSYSKKELELLKESGMEVSLELKDDKSAVLNLFGIKQDLKYDDNYFYSKGEKIVYTFDNNIISIVDEDEMLSFEMTK